MGIEFLREIVDVRNKVILVFYHKFLYYLLLKNITLLI